MGAPLDPRSKAKIFAMDDVGHPKAEIARSVPCSWPTVQSCLQRGDREPLEDLIAEARRGLRDALYMTAYRSNARVLDEIDNVPIKTAGDLRNMAVVTGVAADKIFRVDPDQDKTPLSLQIINGDVTVNQLHLSETESNNLAAAALRRKEQERIRNGNTPKQDGGENGSQ